MSDTPQTTNESKILGAFAGSVGIFSIALYFTGWIYRWAYFGFFKLELNALNLPAQSFFFVSIQVFLGSLQAFFQASLALIIVGILIRVTLWLLLPPSPKQANHPSLEEPTRVKAFQSKVDQLIQKLWRSRIVSKLHSLLRSLVELVKIIGLPVLWLIYRLRYVARIFPPSVLKDLVIVTWILTCLFWIARWQGEVDARRAAVNETSALPVITLVHNEKGLGIGRGLSEAPNKIPLDPSLEKTRIIGDAGLFEKLRGKETIYAGDPTQPTAWRLLINTNGWIYVFKALPPNTDSNQRPLVIAIREGGGEQLMILSPTASKPGPY